MTTKKKQDSVSKIDQIAELIRDLSGEERSRLSEVGIDVPEYMSADGEAVWGYHCKHCGQIAFEFVGTSFKTPEGEELDAPPTMTPLRYFPWRQPKLPAHKVNRSHPGCQHCMAPVRLINGEMIMGKHVIHIGQWSKARSEAPKRKRELLQALRNSTQGEGGPNRPLGDRAPNDNAPTYDAQDRQLVSQVADERGLIDVIDPSNRSVGP